MGQLDEVAGGALLNLYPPVDGLTEQQARDELARLRKRLLSAITLIDECYDVLGNHEDVRDGEDGPSANDSMQARMAIDEWRGSRV